MILSTVSKELRPPGDRTWDGMVMNGLASPTGLLSDGAL